MIEIRKLKKDEPVEEIAELEGLPEEDDAYSYDMMNVEHATKNAKQNSVLNSRYYLDSYTRIMFLGNTLNRFYNRSLGLIKEDPTDIK